MMNPAFLLVALCAFAVSVADATRSFGNLVLPSDTALVSPSGSNSYMDCMTAPVCGVLTLETGGGRGVYGHGSPTVHGLWPQVPPYGNSACLRPEHGSPPEYSWRHPERLQCYNTELPKHYTEDDYSKEYGFEKHEWTKHGMCAGVKDAEDFLDTVCGLAKAPLEVMRDAQAGTRDIDAIADALRGAGYPVFYVDRGYTQQIELSLCAGPDHIWRMAKPEDFDKVCGSKEPRPPSPAGQCVHMQHGPPCSSDADCIGITGCVRCAHSGFCTDVKLPGVTIHDGSATF